MLQGVDVLARRGKRRRALPLGKPGLGVNQLGRAHIVNGADLHRRRAGKVAGREEVIARRTRALRDVNGLRLPVDAHVIGHRRQRLKLSVLYLYVAYRKGLRFAVGTVERDFEIALQVAKHHLVASVLGENHLLFMRPRTRKFSCLRDGLTYRIPRRETGPEHEQIAGLVVAESKRRIGDIPSRVLRPPRLVGRKELYGLSYSARKIFGELLTPHLAYFVLHVGPAPLHGIEYPRRAGLIHVERAVETLRTRGSDEDLILGNDALIRPERTFIGAQYRHAAQDILGRASHGNEAVVFALIIICIGCPPVVGTRIVGRHIIYISHLVPVLQVGALVGKQPGVIRAAF